MTALHVVLLAPERVRSLTVSSVTAGGDKNASHDISQFLKLLRYEAAKQAMTLQDTHNATLQQADPQAVNTALKQRQAFEREFADPSISSGGYARFLSVRAAHDCVADLDRIDVSVTVIFGQYDLQARP